MKQGDLHSPGGLSPDGGQGGIESQDMLMGIIASATDAIITVNAEQKVTLFNAAAERMFKFKADEALGMPLTKFIPERFREAHQHHVKTFGETGVSNRTMGAQRPLAALRADGVEFPVEATISQITVKGQKVYTAILRDITERLQAEKARAELAAIVESSDDGIIGKSLDGIISTWNKGAEHIFGYTAEEMVGRSVLTLIPKDRQHEEVNIRERLTRGEPMEHYETVRLTKDGNLIDVSLTVSPMRNAAGKIIGASKIVRDITARKRAEESLARQAEELARSNMELERFAYVASHDLQEPLRTVHSFSQLLERRCGTALTGEGVEFLKYITDGVQRMQNLINDLLAFSRLNSQGAAFAPVDCEEILSRVLEDMKATLDAVGVRVVRDALPTVVGDATQLRQLLQNLLVNAVKFRRKETPQVRVSAVERDWEWIFSVADNGIGIAKAYYERIFVIFQRLHTIEEYPGTGMGLAICKKIVQRHGGRIWVESEEGRGSTFYFSLPKREKTK